MRIGKLCKALCFCCVKKKKQFSYRPLAATDEFDFEAPAGAEQA
eukprot:SAG22_NODE_16_length_32723_cov_26.404825_34_plen_44_part_00